VTTVKSAQFRLVFDQNRCSIFNNSEEAKRFNPAPGNESGED